jgi:hypothetical protein
MGRTSTARLLRRLREMDDLLIYNGLNIKQFARKFRVSTKTVRRDLKMLADDFGRPSEWHYLDEYIWKYRSPRRRLFVSVRQDMGLDK